MKNKNIEIIENKNGLPISVIIPLSKHREWFFNEHVLPMIQINQPSEIIINRNKGTAPTKRNHGFKRSKKKYVFFCDDDIVLPKSLLKTFYDVLERNKDVGYAYCGYTGIVFDPKNHPMKGNFSINSTDFDSEKLKRGNYISTMSLMRREVFPKFDESLNRLQDWDLYLTMMNKGITGKFVKNMRFMAFYLDQGITNNTNDIHLAHHKIKEKHSI